MLIEAPQTKMALTTNIDTVTQGLRQTNAAPVTEASVTPNGAWQSTRSRSVRCVTWRRRTRRQRKQMQTASSPFSPQFFLSNLLWLSLRPTLEPILYILWLFLGFFLLISPFSLAEQWPELMMTDLQGADSGFYMARLKKIFSLDIGALLNKWIWPYCYRILKLGTAVLFYQSQPNCTDPER